MILGPDDLRQLTGYKRPSDQMRGVFQRNDEMTNDDLRQLVARLRTADNPLVASNGRELFRAAADMIERLSAPAEPVQCNPADYCVAQHMKLYAHPAAPAPEPVAKRCSEVAERLEAASYALPGGWDQEDNPRPRNVCTEAADFLREIATLQSKVANQSDAVANPAAPAPSFEAAWEYEWAKHGKPASLTATAAKAIAYGCLTAAPAPDAATVELPPYTISVDLEVNGEETAAVPFWNEGTVRQLVERAERAKADAENYMILANTYKAERDDASMVATRFEEENVRLLAERSSVLHRSFYADDYKAIEAERDALKELLREAREQLGYIEEETAPWTKTLMMTVWGGITRSLLARIDAALNPPA